MDDTQPWQPRLPPPPKGPAVPRAELRALAQDFRLFVDGVSEDHEDDDNMYRARFDRALHDFMEETLNAYPVFPMQGRKWSFHYFVPERGNWELELLVYICISVVLVTLWATGLFLDGSLWGTMGGLGACLATVYAAHYLESSQVVLQIVDGVGTIYMILSVLRFFFYRIFE